MKNILILFSILLFSGLVLTANAQSANHVVINEIDINPPGDDSKSISEWVELYNPTSSKIDISGWQIASTTGLKKTLTIPTGTFIEPGKFLTFSYQSLWFTDNNEIVELKDKNAMVVDKTPLFSDILNDFSSWQRIYDGYDTDNVSDWKFVISTAGSSNGKLTSVKESDSIMVSISTDKSSYLFDETAIIQGSVSKQVFIEKPYFHADEILIKISGPNFDKTISLYPDLKLNYKTTLNLQKVLGINKGTYNVSVIYGGASSQTHFSVDDKTKTSVVQEEGSLSLTTDKSQYLPGDSLLITSVATKIIPFEGLKFTIKDPNGNVASTGTLYPTNGQFSTKVFLTTVNPVYGQYSITAEYFDKGAQIFFEVVKDIKETKAISLWTDKDAYGLGETVTITGRLNQQWIAFMDLEIIQTKNAALASSALGGGNSGFTISDTLKISGDGSFAYSFKIPDSDTRLGDYKITVSKDIGSASKIIHAVANSTGYVQSTEPLSLSTDKVIYDLGDTMTINGFIANYEANSNLQIYPVKISIYHADGSPLNIVVPPPNAKTINNNGVIINYEFTAIPDSSGRFSLQTKITQNTFTEGSYKIKAEYVGQVKSIVVGIIDSLKSNAVLLTLNKQVYGLGEPVLLTGLLPPLGGNTVQISLVKPDGSTVDSGATIDNQRFSWSWVTPITEKDSSIKQDDRSISKSNYGIYKIHISYPSTSKDVFFKVSANPESDSLSLSPLNVSPEKSLYKAGEKLKVIGNVVEKEQTSQGLIPERITILVLDGKFPFKQISESTVYPDHGTFQSSFELPVTIFTEGEYKVKAVYSGKTAESTFTVANDFAYGSDDKLSLLLATDKSEYHPGDIVTVSGKPNKLIYIEKFDVSVIQKIEGSLTCGSFYCGTHVGPVTTIRPSESGSFSHQFQIPDSSSSIGSYEITVDAGFAVKSLMFNVVEKPVVIESVKSSTIIEKVNRILDDQIPVLTNEKTVNGTVMLPRVFSGSLIVAKTDQSNVNLMVTSESGVCVIGPEENCLVKDSTRKQGQIYDVVTVDGINLKVRYSGPDVFFEKFDILPESDDGFLPDTNWNVDIIKDSQASRFYYKINYSVLG
ncbi:MAG: lamin tail domain-containing protein [Nitrosarchaeum sp.]|nr:lamin tail domain-containing protein [Nitrosarchaeum sp.]